MQTNISQPARFLRISQDVYKFLLIFLVIGFVLNGYADALPLYDYHPVPLKFAGKNPQKLEALRHDFWTKFFSENVAKAKQVSVEGGFSLPITQQPEGKTSFVTNKSNLITQFSTPALNGVTGLLAHNYRSGQEFYNLKIGQKVTVEYSEGIVRSYQIVSIHRYQKLDRSSIYSNLVDLETNQEMSSTEVYNRFYGGADHVTFQTCLANEGRLDWGLIFFVAEPIDQAAAHLYSDF